MITNCTASLHVTWDISRVHRNLDTGFWAAVVFNVRVRGELMRDESVRMRQSATYCTSTLDIVAKHKELVVLCAYRLLDWLHCHVLYCTVQLYCMHGQRLPSPVSVDIASI